MRLRRTIFYSGRVQGVGFRATVHTLAIGRPVTGFVRNLSDGRVEAVFEGEAADIDRLVAVIDERMAGHVTDRSVADGAATGEFRGFEVRR